eukprot:GHUV01010715.1.p1 GENE.GHUV01010715.1~~GHUV01010715.1.p1  ORF type:complete len:139 (+),score=22.43 GHUV01010715.1:734-1150(+)
MLADIFKQTSLLRAPHNSSSGYGLSLVNLAKLDDVSLKRYWRVFQLNEDMGLTATKEDLVNTISRHFTTQVSSDHMSSKHSHVACHHRRPTATDYNLSFVFHSTHRPAQVLLRSVQAWQVLDQSGISSSYPWQGPESL